MLIPGTSRNRDPASCAEIALWGPVTIKACTQKADAMTSDGRAFGNQLRTARQFFGLSQEELAERSGMSVRAIGSLERGSSKWPHPSSIGRLADALGLGGQARERFFVAGRRRPAYDGAVLADVPQESLPDRADRQVIPRQLPCPVAQFAGRQAELARLTSLLDQAHTGEPSAVVISAIGGTPGVGKTALALHWAHQVADRFPDGQLYLNLRGFDASGGPLPPGTAIRYLLEALQFPGERIPASAEAQAGLYRSLLSGRRMLVILDNARDAAQVLPLLPGNPGCLVLVTSRCQLAGLAAVQGAHLLTLDLLTETDARELLAQRLGATRLDDEPEAATQVIKLCARLPLALAIVAARASVRPLPSLGALAVELGEAGRRLDALETGDALASVRTVFSLSVSCLSADSVRMFRLLGLHSAPDITIPAAASLAGMLPALAHRVLSQLTQAHLITEPVPGRFVMHDLLRAYAAELAEAGGTVHNRRAALTRLFDYYLSTSAAAMDAMFPAERDRRPDAGLPAAPVQTFSSATAAEA